MRAQASGIDALFEVDRHRPGSRDPQGGRAAGRDRSAAVGAILIGGWTRNDGSGHRSHLRPGGLDPVTLRPTVRAGPAAIEAVSASMERTPSSFNNTAQSGPSPYARDGRAGT